MRRWVSAVLAGLFFYSLAGCDVLTDENGTIILPEEMVVSFRYEFGSEGRSPGEAFEVAALQSADLTQELLRVGFRKDEVVSAEVVRVELERIMPLNVNLSFLSEAAVELTASNTGPARIAQASTLPADRSARLPLSDRSATRFVRSPSFTSRLVVTPAELQPDEDYILQVTVRLRIEVQDV